MNACFGIAASAVCLTAVCLTTLAGPMAAAPAANLPTPVDLPFARDPLIEAQVDSLLQPLVDDDLISGSVLIARNGKILLAKGYGLANREYGAPDTPFTKFRLGSLTKQFTAAAIMVLEQRGLLRVTDPLRKYYPDFPDGDRITLHHLLTHTSGLANYNDMPGYNETVILPWGVDQVIDWFRGQPPLSEPGTAFAYSNSNYVLLAGVIEHVTGSSYAGFLREALFAPLGMRDTGQDIFTDILPGRAAGFGSTGDTLYQVPYRDMPFMSGAGSLYSTVYDLYRWDRALYTDTPLSAESRARMFQPALQNYGYGWFVEDRDGHAAISHGGAISGFMTTLDRYTADSVLVVALFNFETTFYRAALQSLDAIALGQPWRPLLPREPVLVADSTLAALSGRFLMDRGDTLTVAVEQGRLVLQSQGEQAVVPAAVREDLFWVRPWNAMVRFVRDPEGDFGALRVLQGAAGIKGRRLS